MWNLENRKVSYEWNLNDIINFVRKRVLNAQVAFLMMSSLYLKRHLCRQEQKDEQKARWFRVVSLVRTKHLGNDFSYRDHK